MLGVEGEGKMALLVFQEEDGVVNTCIALYIVLDRRISIARTASVTAIILIDKIFLSNQYQH